MKSKGYKFENILFDKDGRVGIITLNRPDRLNALSLALQSELATLLGELEKDDETVVVIITGAPRPDGRPCFSAGADIKEMRELGGTYSQLTLGTLDEGLLKTLSAFGESKNVANYSAWDRVQDFPKPLIAAIDGICTAGGLELAMRCDIRIVSETAEIRDQHMKNLGILGGRGLQTWLPRLINVGKAKELIWTGDAIDGREAWRLGLAQRLSSPEKLLDDAKDLARKIAAMPPLALRISKEVINSGLSQGVYDSLRFSALAEALLRYLKSEEHAKAREAFVKKGE